MDKIKLGYAPTRRSVEERAGRKQVQGSDRRTGCRNSGIDFVDIDRHQRGRAFV